MDASIMRDLLIPDVSLVEKIIRPVLVYFFLIGALRLAGKRELAQLNPFDLIVLLTLSNTVQNAIIGNDNSVTGGVVGAATLLLVNYVVIRFLYKHPVLDRAIEGDAVVLIDQGCLREECLKRELITLPELQEAAHKQGFESLDHVDRAILEPGGSITFIGRQPSHEDIRYQELLQRLDAISRDLAALKP